MTIVVMDGPTASTLAQILPLLLLTLILELRRTALHRKVSRILFGAFFVVFGVIETVLVLSSTVSSTRSNGAICCPPSPSSGCLP